MLSLIVLTVVFLVDGSSSLHCRRVEVGEHFPSDHPPEQYNWDYTISTRIYFHNNTAHYLFSPTDTQGYRCSDSYNMLWGATRCGYKTGNHEDSDRFVWRRALSCLIFDSSGHVIGEKPDCPDANLIEIAAYAYDGGRKPFQHMGTLLKHFSKKLHVERWYLLKIRFHETETIYELFESDEHHHHHHHHVLESHTIHHRSCHDFHHGNMQSFYFGGVCPAPQEVSVCYKEL